MSNLDILRRLVSPSNMTQSSPWMAKRRAEIYSGMDDMLPDGDSPEYKAAQIRFGNEGIPVSRDSMRTSDMSKLRQRLNLQRIEHEQELEQGAQKGQFEIDKARQEAEAYADRLGLQEDSWMRRDAARQGALDQRTQFVQGQVSERAGNRQTTGAPTEGMEKRLAESRKGPGPLARFIPGRQAASREAHERNLVSVLTRMGSLRGLQADLGTLQGTEGASLDERITNAGGDPSELHPYEREWLELQLGR